MEQSEDKIIDSVEEIRQEKWESIREELIHLSSIDSFSTEEGKLREYLIERAVEMGIKTETDEKGNLWFLSDQPEGEIMLCAHMDKVGKGVEIEVEGDNVKGRLDDALGISVILSLFKDGLRPSALFTVEEESQQEKEGEDGQMKMLWRKMKGGIYNAGARQAADEIFLGQKSIPKLIIIVDVSKSDEKGGGPLVYTSSMHFRFPNSSLKSIRKILADKGISAKYLDGQANDSIEFTFRPLKGVAAVEIHVDDMHTEHEVANVQDIVALHDALKEIIENHDNVEEADKLAVHAEPKTGPFILPEFMERAEKFEPFIGQIDKAIPADLKKIIPILQTWLENPAMKVPSEDGVGDFTKRFEKNFTTEDRKFFVAKEGDELVGVIELGEISDELKSFSLAKKSLEIYNIYVDKVWRGHGVGQQLIDKAEKEALSLGTGELILKSGIVYKNVSWQFYAQRGFEDAGDIKDYYGQGADAKVWRKKLTYK